MDSCGDAEIIVSEGRSMEAELLVYYVILTTWLFPDKDFWVHQAGAVSCILSFVHYTHSSKCFWEMF